MNLCRRCNQDFASVRLFDAHRVGVHAYTFSEGMDLDPPVEDGRRCLDIPEMQEKGWTQDDQGQWCDLVRAAATRKAFAGRATP